MELCKKCNCKHDLKKSCTPKKELKKFRDAPPAPPLAPTLGGSIASGLSGGIKKSTKPEKPKSYNDMKKSDKNRCWDGYKPAPGKKPYSDDSCVKKVELEKGTFDPKEKVSDVSTQGHYARHAATNPKAEAELKAKGVGQDQIDGYKDGMKRGAMNAAKDRAAKERNIKPNLPKSERMMEKMEPGMSFSDLKKREDDMMALEDKTNSLAAHIKDVLKKIK